MRVGRLVRVLEDVKRKETLVDSDENRRVIISFHYPVDEKWEKNEQAFYKELYFPREDKFFEKFKNVVKLENDDEKEEHLNSLRTNIHNNAPMSKKEISYPVILQSAGLGCPRDYSSFNVEKLVNEGYVVFTIEHMYDSVLSVLPNGEVFEALEKELTQEYKENLIDTRKKDILFVLDELEKINANDEVIKNKLNLNRIGIVGHSLGGAAVFKASEVDSRIKATVLFDPSLQCICQDNKNYENEALSTPVLNMRRGSFKYEPSMQMYIDYLKENSDAENFKKQVIEYDKILRNSKNGQKELFRYLTGYKSFLKINGSTHMTFTDYPLISKENQPKESLAVEESHNLINEISIRFLNEFLCGEKGRYTEFINKENNYITQIDGNGDEI